MLTENKVTELFCMADDFCKFFDRMVAKYTFKSTAGMIFCYCCPLNVLLCLTMLFLAIDKPPLKGFNGCPLNKSRPHKV